MTEATVAAVGAAPLDTLLGLAAIFLGLALLVQVIQELWKFLSSSKAKTYRTVLQDFLGPFVEQLYEVGPATRLQVRSPLQFFRSKPRGELLPLEQNELLNAMDSLAPDWLGYALEAIKKEKELGDGGNEPSPQFAKALTELREAAEGPADPRSANAARALSFLRDWGVDEPDSRFDAARILTAFYQEFFPERATVEREFAQVARNFEHAYGRRNLRQSFVLGLGLALLFGFPFRDVLRQASQLSHQEAVELAEGMLARSNELKKLANTGAAEVPSPDANGGADGAAEGATGTGAPDDASAEPASGPSASAQDEPTGTEADTPDDTDVEASDPSKTAERLRDTANEILDALTAKDDVETPLLARGRETLRRFAVAEARKRQARDEKAGNEVPSPLRRDWMRAAAAYFGNCLITALLISFGAPFWHRLSSALLKVGKAGKPGSVES